MANAARIFVPILNHRAKAEVTTGFDANFPVANCLDFNVDSYAYPSAAAHAITIDTDATFGTYAAVQYAFAALYLQNVIDIGAAADLEIKCETSTDVAFTAPSDRGTKTIISADHLPFVIWQFGSSTTDRYLRFTFAVSAIKAKTALALWGLPYTILNKHEWQRPTVAHAVNAVDQMGAGRQIVRNFRHHTPYRFSRLYRMVSDAELLAIQNIHLWAHGRWMPLILLDDPDTADDASARLIRLLSDDLEWVEQQVDLNDVTLNFEHVPVTTDGAMW